MTKLSTLAMISFAAIATASIANSSFAQSASNGARGGGGVGGGGTEAGSETLQTHFRRTKPRKRKELPNSCSCKLKTKNSLNGQSVATTICLRKVILDNAITSVRCRG